MNFNMILSNILNFLIVFYIGKSTLEFKKRPLIKYIVFYFFIILFQCISNNNGPNHCASIVTIINFILLISYTFKCSFHETLLISFFSLVFGSLAEFLSMIIMYFLLDLGPQTSIASITYFLALILSNFIFFIFSNIFIYLKKTYSPGLPQERSWNILIVPFSTILIFMNISDYYSLVQNDESVLICFIFLVLSNIITLFYFYKLLNSVNLEKQLQEEKLLKERTELEYKLLSNQYNNNYTLLHTLLHSYIDLKKLLNEKKYHELSKQIDDLSNDVFSEFNSISTGSLILNIVISNKLETLRKFNIKIRSSILYSDFTFMDLIDQKSFFNTLINLSINDCKKNEHDKRIIFISSKIQERKIYFHLYFPVSCQKNYKENLFQKNKELNRIIKKYDINFTLNQTKTKDINILHICYEKERFTEHKKT